MYAVRDNVYTRETFVFFLCQNTNIAAYNSAVLFPWKNCM